MSGSASSWSSPAARESRRDSSRASGGGRRRTVDAVEADADGIGNAARRRVTTGAVQCKETCPMPAVSAKFRPRGRSWAAGDREDGRERERARNSQYAAGDENSYSIEDGPRRQTPPRGSWSAHDQDRRGARPNRSARAAPKLQDPVVPDTCAQARAFAAREEPRASPNAAGRVIGVVTASAPEKDSSLAAAQGVAARVGRGPIPDEDTRQSHSRARASQSRRSGRSLNDDVDSRVNFPRIGEASRRLTEDGDDLDRLTDGEESKEDLVRDGLSPIAEAATPRTPFTPVTPARNATEFGLVGGGGAGGGQLVSGETLATALGGGIRPELFAGLSDTLQARITAPLATGTDTGASVPTQSVKKSDGTLSLAD